MTILFYFKKKVMRVGPHNSILILSCLSRAPYIMLELRVLMRYQPIDETAAMCCLKVDSSVTESLYPPIQNKFMSNDFFMLPTKLNQFHPKFLITSASFDIELLFANVFFSESYQCNFRLCLQ